MVQPFRLRTDARVWFRELRDHEKSFKVDFDSFYFCFMAGVASRRKLTAAREDTAELVDYFPDRYTARGKLLVALFLARELDELGVTINEKKAVHSAIRRLVNPDSPNHLSDDGVAEFNRYAHGGFGVLRDDWFDDRPRTLETFLRAFKHKIDERLAET